MPQPASALSPQSDPINSKTASVVHPREWMPCPSCPLCSRAPKTRHFTSYKQATHHELRTNISRCTCFLDQMFHLCSRHGCNRGQEGPLIRIRRKRIVDELAVARASRDPLKRQGNQVAEATRWHEILARKKPIVGSESDIGDALHRVGNK